MNIVSQVNGECQKLRLPVLDQVGGRRVKKGERMAPTSTYDSGESSNKSPSLPKLASVSPSCATRCFSNCFLCARTRKKCNLGFLQPFGTPRCRPHWFSKPDAMGAPLPRVGPPGWGLDPSLFAGISEVLIFVGHCMGSSLCPS